ncbi:MAG: 50S ribosomal protein L24 [Patescibacteria group bacterium]|nr:50S ribosomal protein L24 [Patescibacteria group bacterium]
MKIRKGDTILVVKGKDKGKKAKVLRGFPEGLKVLVEGVNIKKKHKRPKREGEKGQIIEVPVPLPVSKVKLICPKCGKPTRIRFKVIEKKKYRVCKKCGEEI